MRKYYLWKKEKWDSYKASYHDGYYDEYASFLRTTESNWECLGYVETTRELYDLFDRPWRFRRGNGNRNHGYRTRNFTLSYEEYDFKIYDVVYLIVDDKQRVRDFYELTKWIEHENPYDSYWFKKRQFEFRNGPVPYTGHGKWHFGNNYKKPKCKQKFIEKTVRNIEYDELIAEYGSSVVHWPKYSYIANSWDDDARSDRRNKKSWKYRNEKKKKHQWER